jgi:prepilin-type N-terminal cleavage/methylation domain-containing protein
MWNNSFVMPAGPNEEQDVRPPEDRKGFTLVEMMIVVAVIAVLVAIAVPNYMQARESAATRACISNLRQIEQAKEQFAMEAAKKDGDTAEWSDLVPAYIKTQPSCPFGADYTIGVIGTRATCIRPGHVLP